MSKNSCSYMYCYTVAVIWTAILMHHLDANIMHEENTKRKLE